MNKTDRNACVRIVGQGLRDKIGKERIIKNIQQLGVPEAFLEDMYSVIESGLKSGVNAAVTNGLSARDYKRGESELFDEAFEAGFKALKWQVYKRWLKRVGIFFALVLTALAICILLISSRHQN